jgi:hypothetical protein
MLWRGLHEAAYWQVAALGGDEEGFALDLVVGVEVAECCADCAFAFLVAVVDCCVDDVDTTGEDGVHDAIEELEIVVGVWCADVGTDADGGERELVAWWNAEMGFDDYGRR